MGLYLRPWTNGSFISSSSVKASFMEKEGEAWRHFSPVWLLSTLSLPLFTSFLTSWFINCRSLLFGVSSEWDNFASMLTQLTWTGALFHGGGRQKQKRGASIYLDLDACYHFSEWLKVDFYFHWGLLLNQPLWQLIAKFLKMYLRSITEVLLGGIMNTKISVWLADSWFTRSPQPGVCVHARSVLSNSGALWTVARQASLPMGFSSKNTRASCHFLLQGIFPTQGSKLHLLRILHCRQILHHWAIR